MFSKRRKEGFCCLLNSYVLFQPDNGLFHLLWDLLQTSAISKPDHLQTFYMLHLPWNNFFSVQICFSPRKTEVLRTVFLWTLLKLKMYPLFHILFQIHQLCHSLSKITKPKRFLQDLFSFIQHPFHRGVSYFNNDIFRPLQTWLKMCIVSAALLI